MTLLAATLLLAAASTPRPATLADLSRVAPISACAAATRQELQRAVGAPIDAGKPRQEAGGSACDFIGENGQVTISLHHTVEPLDFAKEITNLKSAMPEARLTEIPMSGVRALLVDLDPYGVQIHLLRNGRDYMLVSVLGFGDSARTRVIAEVIAQRALSRF